MLNKKHLSNSEVKEINSQLNYLYHTEDAIDKKDVAILEENILKVNNRSRFFYYAITDSTKIIVPTLKNILENIQLYEKLKKITVDIGAVRFIVSGADIMRPGIVDFSNGINKDDVILIVDVNHKKPLAVGIMQFSGEDAKALISGKIVKNVHYVGDKIWNS